jgi:hypothetical protein
MCSKSPHIVYLLMADQDDAFTATLEWKMIRSLLGGSF